MSLYVISGTVSAATVAFVIARFASESSGSSMPNSFLFRELDGLRMLQTKADASETLNTSEDNVAARALMKIREILIDENPRDSSFPEKYKYTSPFVDKIVKIAILRLIPVVPFSISNYVVGFAVKKIDMISFVTGTVLGMCPWMFFYSFVGSTGMQKLLESNSNSDVKIDDVITFDSMVRIVSKIQENEASSFHDLSTNMSSALAFIGVGAFCLVSALAFKSSKIAEPVIVDENVTLEHTSKKMTPIDNDLD